MDICRAALSVLPRLILAATAVRDPASLDKSSATFRVHAVAMELRLWRLLAVVAAVLLAGGHLAATRGMGALVLIGLCVRHMRPLPEFIQRAACRSCRLQAARLGCRAWPTRNSTHLSTEPPSSRSELRPECRSIHDCVDRATSGPLNSDYGCGVAIRLHVHVRGHERRRRGMVPVSLRGGFGSSGARQNICRTLNRRTGRSFCGAHPCRMLCLT